MVYNLIENPLFMMYKEYLEELTSFVCILKQ